MVMMRMSVMMMVMMVSAVAAMLNVTMHLGAILTFVFKLKRCVANSVLAKLRSYLFLDLACLAIYNDVHSRIVFLTVHTPNVDVMNVQNAFDLANMLLDLVYLNASRRFFK
jgi:hypothetical protein